MATAESPELRAWLAKQREDRRRQIEEGTALERPPVPWRYYEMEACMEFGLAPWEYRRRAPQERAEVMAHYFLKAHRRDYEEHLVQREEKLRRQMADPFEGRFRQWMSRPGAKTQTRKP